MNLRGQLVSVLSCVLEGTKLTPSCKESELKFGREEGPVVGRRAPSIRRR